MQTCFLDPARAESEGVELDWYDDPVQVGPESFRIDSKVVSPEELVHILRRESPMLLHHYTYHPGVNVLLNDYERMSPNQKYAIW